jgi:hypothetical protein
MNAIFTLFAVGAAAFAWLVVKSKLTIWQDRIEYTNGFVTRALRRGEIRGYRRNRKAGSIKLIPIDASARPIPTSASALHDPATSEWFRGLPDLSTLEREAAEQALREDLRLGATPEARRKRLQQITRVTKALSWAGYGLGLWIWFWPRPYNIAVLTGICAVLLSLALKVWLGSLLNLNDDKQDDPRPSIGTFFFFPATAVVIRALFDINFLEVESLLKWTALSGAALCALLLAADRTARQSVVTLVFFPILILAFCFGALAETNMIFDTSQPQVFRTTIRDKHMETGKNAYYRLTLGGWNGRPAGDDPEVTSSYYASVRVGETVCVYLSNGRFGFRYYGVGRCN